MSKISILKNTIALAIPQILNPFISFLLILAISRYLGVEGLGQYSLVLAYAGIFGTLATLGLGDLLVREAARDEKNLHAFFFNALLLGAISAFVALLLMNAFVAILGYERDVIIATLIMSFSLIASTGINFMEAVFRSVEKSNYIALVFLIENTVRVAICILLLLAGYGTISLFLAVLGTRIFGFVLFCFFYKRILGPPKFQFRVDIWRVLVKESPTFASIAIFSTIHLSIDSIMLSKLQDIESVGIYSAADRLLTVCKTMPVAFASALLPFFAKEFTTNRRSLQKLALDSIRYISLILFPLVLGTSILADSFITLLYGGKFATAGPVLRLHIVSLIPFSMVFIFAQVLIATNNQRVDLQINIVAAFVNFILNFVLIPSFGVMGAVLSTLISIIIFNELQNVFIRKHLFRLPLIKVIHKPLIASLGMGIFTYFLKDINIFINVALSAVIYMLLLLLLGSVTREELNFFKMLLNKITSKG